MTVAVLTGTQIVDGRRVGLLIGVGLMALGGWIVGTCPTGSRSRLISGWSVAAVGAAVIPWRGQIDPDAWFFVATPIVALVYAGALSAWSASTALRWIGALTAITAFAIWTTVPDTDLARLLLGVAFPLAFGTLPPVSAAITASGGFAFAGVLAWLPTLGGEARPASIIGAWASIGMIVLIPVAARLWPRRQIRTSRMFVIHALVTLVAARVIGLWSWALPATVAASCLYLAALGATYWLGRETAGPDVKLPG